MKKKYMIIAVIAVFALAVLLIYPSMKDSSASKELLNAVGVPEDIKFYAMVRHNWTNTAGYKSGYDIMAMDIDPADWTTPDGWVNEPTTIAAVAEKYGVVFKDMSAVDKLETYDLFAEYGEWYFAETRGGTEEYPEHEFHIAVYSEGTLIIYRGSNLQDDWIDMLLAE